MPRFVLGDEHGNLHLLTLVTAAAAGTSGGTGNNNSNNNNHNNRIVALQLDTLGTCTLTNCLQYLDHGLVFCGSTLGDSQLDSRMVTDTDPDTTSALGETTFLSVVEEYTHLGPIVDFDLSQVVTASGSCRSGSLRVIRNGIGMKEYASVELSGIQSMWNLRGSYDDTKDTYLVQSFVGETRVLGVIAGDEEDEDE
eukprot:jgi/Psemu1/202348/e_gw1.296.14.1